MAPPDAREKTFTIRGSPEAVERAKAMIMEKLGLPGGGGGYGGGGGPSAGYGGSWSAQYPTPAAGGYPPDSSKFSLNMYYVQDRYANSGNLYRRDSR